MNNNIVYLIYLIGILLKVQDADATIPLENAVVHEGGINLKLDVKVPIGMIGLEKEGDIKIGTTVLTNALHTSYPSKITPLLDETRQPLVRTRGTKVAVEYELSYAVFHLLSAHLLEYESLLVDQLTRSVGQEGPMHVDAGALEEFFESLLADNGYLDEHELLPGVNSTPLILILNPNLGRLQKRLGMAETPRYQYYLDESEASCAEAWISQNAVLVLDLASMACENKEHSVFPRSRQEIQNTRTTPAPKASDVVVDAVLSELLLSDDSVDVNDNAPMFRNQLGPIPGIVNAVISSLQNVLLSDVTVWPHDTRQRLICPILVLSGDKLSKTSPVDLAAVQHSLNGVRLPGQEIIALTTEHTLHDHPQVATALMKAHRTRRVYRPASAAEESDNSQVQVVEESYFDGPSLLETMRSAGDVLANHVFEETGAPLLHLELEVELGEEWEEQKTQVLPIYIFRVTDFFGSETGVSNFFEDGSPVYATHDAVLILQDESLSDASGLVVSGLISSLYGLSPPHLHFTNHHGFHTSDLLWAKGYHPFPAFGSSLQFSKVFFYSASRNVVVARMLVCLMFADDISDLLEDFVAEYLPVQFLPEKEPLSSWSKDWAGMVLDIFKSSAQPPPTKLLEIVEKVHGYLQTVIKDFNDVYKFVTAGNLEHATDLSAAILSEARVLFQEVQVLIGDATIGLACCEKSYVQSIQPKESSWIISLSLLMSMLFVIFLLYNLQIRYGTTSKLKA